MGVFYEWDYETVDTSMGDVDSDEVDILDHMHQDRLIDFRYGLEANQRLVLVRDDTSPSAGAQGRLWAYVDRKSGMLPKMFRDAWGSEVRPVPKRFHRELAAYVARFGL